MDTTAQGLIDLYTRMRSDSSGMVTLWNDVGRMCLTRKVDALTAAINRTADATTSFTPYDSAIINSVAVDATTVNAAGCAAWITPSGGGWFKFEPLLEFKVDAVESWLANCTDIALTYLAASNFYTKVHELYIDRVVTGTTTLTCEAGRRSALVFRVFDPGSFIIADNDESEADMLFRERQFTARQAVEKFGSGNVSSKVRDDYGPKPNALHRYLQCVYPRPVNQQGKGGAAGFPFAEKWIDVAEKSQVTESGFEELPFFASRYLRWSEFSPWGVSPAMQALAEVRGVNFMDMLQATAAEVAVNPRIILPQNFQGVPDLRAGGITIGGASRDTFPQEWGTGARVDWMEPVIARKVKAVERLFHVPLFEQFQSIERQITATEVRAREVEKVARFSPAFTQLTTELLNPLLQRVFMLLMRQGKLPAPPVEALYRDAAGDVRMKYPSVVMTSRMSRAMDALKKSEMADLLSIWAPMAQAGSQALDNLDEDEAFRDMALSSGLPAGYLKESDAVAEFRQKRAEAMAAQQQAEMEREMIRSRPIAEAGVEAMKEAA